MGVDFVGYVGVGGQFGYDVVCVVDVDFFGVSSRRWGVVVVQFVVWVDWLFVFWFGLYWLYDFCYCFVEGRRDGIGVYYVVFCVVGCGDFCVFMYLGMYVGLFLGWVIVGYF